jgi:hypothetical protein
MPYCAAKHATRCAAATPRRQVFLVSLLLYLVLFLYPVAIYMFLNSSINRAIEVGAKLERSALYSATVFMIQSVRLEWKPLRASYRFLLRNIIAIFGVVPNEYSYVLLAVASVALLDCVFIVVKRPYENIGFDIWNVAKGLVLALVIILNLPDVKARLFAKGDGTLTGEQVCSAALRLCVRACARKREVRACRTQFQGFIARGLRLTA